MPSGRRWLQSLQKKWEREGQTTSAPFSSSQHAVEGADPYIVSASSTFPFPSPSPVPVAEDDCIDFLRAVEVVREASPGFKTTPDTRCAQLSPNNPVGPREADAQQRASEKCLIRHGNQHDSPSYPASPSAPSSWHQHSVHADTYVLPASQQHSEQSHDCTVPLRVDSNVVHNSNDASSCSLETCTTFGVPAVLQWQFVNESWTVNEVCTWLTTCFPFGHKYCSIFTHAAVDGSTLVTLDDQGLERLLHSVGIPWVHRQMVLQGILAAGLPQPVLVAGWLEAEFSWGKNHSWEFLAARVDGAALGRIKDEAALVQLGMGNEEHRNELLTTLRRWGAPVNQIGKNFVSEEPTVVGDAEKQQIRSRYTNKAHIDTGMLLDRRADDESVIEDKVVPEHNMGASMWRVLPHQQCQLQDGDDVMQKLQKLQEFSEVKNEYPAHSGQASEGPPVMAIEPVIQEMLVAKDQEAIVQLQESVRVAHHDLFVAQQKNLKERRLRKGIERELNKEKGEKMELERKLQCMMKKMVGMMNQQDRMLPESELPNVKSVRVNSETNGTPQGQP